jgi:hypothetical protein
MTQVEKDEILQVRKLVMQEAKPSPVDARLYMKHTTLLLNALAHYTEPRNGSKPCQ